MSSLSPLSLQDFSENTQILQGKDIFYDNEFDREDDLGFRYDQIHKKTKQITLQKRSLFFYILIVIIVTFVIGVMIGHVTVNKSQQSKLPPHSSCNIDIPKEIIDEINVQNIQENLKLLASEPHLAGSERDEIHLVNLIKKRWASYLDGVDVFPYNVQLSFPNSTNKNFAGILQVNGSITNKSNPDEPALTNFEKQFHVTSAFNAYSPAAHIQGNLFYVNYGREEDFLHIKNSGINITDSICICRYGKLFRGDKVNFADKYGCSALILYSDPLDYANASIHEWAPNNMGNVYPNTWWLPPSGFQRGSTNVGGDPLTPDYPSLNFTYRIPDNETRLPKIPVFPISYQDAYQYLSLLSGLTAPQEWQGGLNITYKYGGAFIASHLGCKMVVHVANYKEKKVVHTVIGYIRGWLEPDRYVLLGNHRDAWTFGAADPNAGTAIVLEVSRAFSEIVRKHNWKPRRTIIFCNWAAEEYGLIGSTEWVEQMEKRLLLQAVSYINIDIAVQGNDTFRALACPSLNQLLFNSTKSVQNPNYNEIMKGRPTVYDTWLHNIPDKTNRSVPFVDNIGSGSDYTFFVQKAGVASADIRYTYKDNLPSYPVYHSIHDTYEYFANFLDKNFNISYALAKVTANSIFELSNAIVLPLNPIDTAEELKVKSGYLQNAYKDVFDGTHISLTELNRTISDFTSAARSLMIHAARLNSSSSDLEVRRVNNKLFYINRGFLDFKGLPGREYCRNVVFAPSSHNEYSGASFPAVADAALEARRGGSLDNVRKQLSVLCIEILSATQLMKDL